MYKYGRVVAVLVLAVVCVLFVYRRSHGVDAPQTERAPTKAQGSKLEETGVKLNRYASEAYPAWAREHHGRECPDTIDDLNKYIGATDSLDLWGHRSSCCAVRQCRRA
jgi:hypothetical protein